MDGGKIILTGVCKDAIIKYVLIGRRPSFFLIFFNYVRVVYNYIVANLFQSELYRLKYMTFLLFDTACRVTSYVFNDRGFFINLVCFSNGRSGWFWVEESLKIQ